MRKVSSVTITSKSAEMDGAKVYEANEEASFLIDLYRHLQVEHPKFHKMDRMSQLGFLSAHLLLKPLKDELAANDEAIAILIANRSSSLETDRTYWDGVGEEGTGSPAKFVYTLPNIVIGEICIYWKQYGETQFLVLPEFDEQRLLSDAEILQANSSAKYVLLGWCEAMGDTLDGRFQLLTV